MEITNKGAIHKFSNQLYEGELGVEEELKVNFWDSMNQMIVEDPHSGSDDEVEKEDDWDDIVLKDHQVAN